MTSSGFHFEVLNQGRSADFSLQPLRNPPTAATKASVHRAFDGCCGLKSSSLPTSLYLFHMTLTTCCLGQKPRRGGLFMGRIANRNLPFCFSAARRVIHCCARNEVERWYAGGDSPGKCRAAEKQKECFGDTGSYKQAAPTGFRAARALATELGAMVGGKFLSKNSPG